MADSEILLLQKINNLLNARTDLEVVFKTIVDGIREMYDYESVAIHLLNKDQKSLTIKSYSAESKVVGRLEQLTGLTVRGYEIPMYEGSLFKEIVDTKKPVITDDVDWVLESYAGRKSFQGIIKIAAKLTKAKWGIGVPLLAGDKVVGVIGCGSVKELTEKDARSYANFGAQVGLAIDKAQIYEKLESANTELTHSNQLKDLFIDIMRHDLLNPAGVIRGMAKMVLDDEKDPDKKKPLQLIQENTERIIDMIENASTLAKLESGEELEFVERDLAFILKSVSTEMTPLADEKNMKIKITAEGEFVAFINALIYEVFSNLINNAIKYGPENSDVIVGIGEEGPNWKISVADNGPGIAEEDKEAIFDRFKRIHKGPVMGSGLGLSIVKRGVELHKGRVWVEDNPEGGSIFYVLLKKAWP